MDALDPSEPIRRVNTNECVAIDIGGTKVEIARVTPAGEITKRIRLETADAQGNLFNQIVVSLRALDVAPGTPIGVGCGGPMERGGTTVSPLNIPEWRNFPLLQALGDIAGSVVSIDNDAKALALAEGRYGGAQASVNYVSMVVSTGIGGGIILDGHLLDGALGNAGHIGHLIVEPGGRLCACGVRGCLEAEASGTAIRAMTGGDPKFANEEMRRRTGVMVGRAVASVASLLDVTQFFVAGSVALGFGRPFFEAANETAESLVGLSFARAVSVQPSKLGADGPILGAACVAWRSVGV
ncbi:MAG: ROK family protein [Actinobacteria bacterium]|nr:ROK family protein [Actinomycetota bacterium]